MTVFAARPFSTAAASVLLLVACSGGDADAGRANGIEPPAGATTVDGTIDAGTDNAGESGTGSGSSLENPDTAVESDPTTIEEFEASWARARAVAVESIGRGGYGVTADNVLVGPGGFQVDLSQCPAGWEDELGSSDVITLGYTAPRTGNLFAYGLIATGFEAYLDYVNSIGGVDGRRLEVLVRDDAYDAGLTVEAVDELLTVEDPFAITTFGDPGAFAVRDRLNQQCVPQPFVESNHPAWGDPDGFPWTTGLQLTYATEARLWGAWIERNMAADLPATIGAVVVDSQFGNVYEQAFSRWAQDNPDVIAEFIPIRHQPQAASLLADVQQLAQQDPDVFIAMTNGTPCLAAVQAVAEAGLSDPETVLFTSSVCKDRDLYMVPGGAGAEGFMLFDGGWKVTSDPGYVDDPFVAWANTTLTAAGADTASGFFGRGFARFGWAYVEALRIAAELDGGLTRSNFLLAQRAVTLEHPDLIDGIAFSSNGSEDAYPVEGSQVLRYDTESQAWQQTGPVIDINGTTPNCSWDGSRC